jgi:high-affinity iron transporter
VVLDIEIQEARAFLDGARAAFADLRLALRERDADATAAIESVLTDLDGALVAAAKHETVAEPAAIAAATEDATRRLQGLFPPAGARAGGDADFDVVAALLDQMEGAVAAKQYQQAESSRLEAYAIFETGPEKRLLAFAPETAQRVERLFWEGDGPTRGLAAQLADHAPAQQLRATRLELDRALAAGQAALGSGQTARGAVIFNAATIVFREGLEAVLILASLLASMVGANRLYRRPLALGAGLAFVVTAALFVLARGVLLALSQYGEKLEAIVSLVAIGVLLLVLNWFFHQVYWTRWIARHHDRRRLVIAGVGGQALGLVLLGFTSVFREGAETVLFLQALVLDAGTAVVVEGTLLGLAATAIVGVLTLVLQTKLPHKKMLIVTGVMIAAVLVTMVGSTVHVMQLVGWAPITPIAGLAGMPYWLGVWFGVYPTWQGVIAQAAAVFFVVGSYVAAERIGGRRRPRATVSPAAGMARGRERKVSSAV